ncbi:T9SS type A sorting domain-containing protein [Mesonia aestuariivivens]|uniref:T9SS type A sorting domain-containing protein n=1 Tax=Mesonia aestuariivivens TaxID=2796128 RepID=A0ABS6W6A6_9FLAO|nr:T9SS type A sorting domain-containing protein [Mesonia aestuariivivens]MBW2962653.1 T9SS type A sorting domain-containing protein [Mesonia aestuariivivens]
MKKITLGIAAILAAFTMNAQTILNADKGVPFTNENNTSTAAAPNVATNPSPSDGETGVYIQHTFSTNSNGQTVTTRVVQLSWDAPTSGDAPAAYEIIFNGASLGDLGPASGETTPPTEVGITGTDITLGATVTWSVIPKNADGSATGSQTWSFTIVEEANINEAPNAVNSALTPVDEATDVEINDDGSITFAFFAAETGAPAIDYDVFFGTDPNNLTNRGTLNSLIGSIPVDASTTYYWYIVAKNGAGSAPASPTWSFTTAQDMSVEDFKNESLSHFVANGILTIDAEQQIEQVELYSILGQRVASQQEVNNKKTTMNVSSLQSGIYLAKVHAKGKTKTFKFVKK